jgi:peptide/nickel transport system ATP-binding protein
VLNQGRVVEQGDTKDVLQHPTDECTVRLLDELVTPLAAASAC